MDEQESQYPKVILLGGAPKSGKSSLGRSLSARLGYALVNTDDLAAAARAVTSPSIAPHLHMMTGQDFQEYYIVRSVDALWNESYRLHCALWPAIRDVCIAHSTWSYPAVIEGWSILPELVAASDFTDTVALWLVVDDPGVFEARTRDTRDFVEGASDEDRLITNFAGRSRVLNDYLLKETARYDALCLHAGPDDSVEELCDRAIELLGAASRPRDVCP